MDALIVGLLILYFYLGDDFLINISAETSNNNITGTIRIRSKVKVQNKIARTLHFLLYFWISIICCFTIIFRELSLVSDKSSSSDDSINLKNWLIPSKIKAVFSVIASFIVAVLNSDQTLFGVVFNQLFISEIIDLI